MDSFPVEGDVYFGLIGILTFVMLGTGRLPLIATVHILGEINTEMVLQHQHLVCQVI